MTCVFTWKAPQATIAWPHASMWGMAVHWARRWFPSVVFYGDGAAQEMLVGGLGLPFTHVRTLPDLPAELSHVYDITKLTALRAAMLEFGRAWLHDHDAHWHRRPAQRLIDAPFVAEYRYRETNEVSKLLFKTVWDFNARLAKPFPESRLALASGLMGGCDVPGIVAACDMSIGLATDPANRKDFAAHEPGAGYWKSVLIGEMQYGRCWPDAQCILADGGGTEDDRRSSGWHHVAGGKSNFGLLAVMDNLFRDDFPQERAAMFHRWRNL